MVALRNVSFPSYSGLAHLTMLITTNDTDCVSFPSYSGLAHLSWQRVEFVSFPSYSGLAHLTVSVGTTTTLKRYEPASAVSFPSYSGLAHLKLDTYPIMLPSHSLLIQVWLIFGNRIIANPASVSFPSYSGLAHRLYAALRLIEAVSFPSYSGLAHLGDCLDVMPRIPSHSLLIQVWLILEPLLRATSANASHSLLIQVWLILDAGVNLYAHLSVSHSLLIQVWLILGDRIDRRNYTRSHSLLLFRSGSFFMKPHPEMAEVSFPSYSGLAHLP